MKKAVLCLSIILLGLILVTCFYCAVNQVQARDLYRYNREGLEFMNNVTEVRASHLLVPTKEEAEKVRQEILEGKDFAVAAQEVSKCPSGSRGGDLGYFGKGQMVQEFEKAAFELPVGQVSEPIQTQYGWHLIVVTDKK